ncbi:hypothetical protein SALBM135S_04614 [Streptomyces alboniger]
MQALAALGGKDKSLAGRSEKSVDWLKSVQNKDGGWGYNPGLPDANSTGIVVGALAAAGQNPAGVKKSGKSAFDALPKLAMDCGKDGGAFGLADAKSGKLAPNADATAAVVLGSLGRPSWSPRGRPLPAPRSARSRTPPRRLRATARPTSSRPSARRTAISTSSMPGARTCPTRATPRTPCSRSPPRAKEQAEKSAEWLADNSADGWRRRAPPPTPSSSSPRTAPAGMDPRDFGGADLVKQLNAQGPAPRTASKSPSAAAEEDKKDDDGGVSIWWIIGVGMVAGIGIGFLYSGNRKKQQP